MFHGLWSTITGPRANGPRPCSTGKDRSSKGHGPHSKAMDPRYRVQDPRYKIRGSAADIQATRTALHGPWARVHAHWTRAQLQRSRYRTGAPVARFSATSRSGHRPKNHGQHGRVEGRWQSPRFNIRGSKTTLEGRNPWMTAQGRAPSVRGPMC